jgi:uncharacterized protein with ParB-like and HNH nuclease domain
MKASEVSLTKFLEASDTHFIIPVYQRNYDWEQFQCEQLLDDILQVGKDDEMASHFIGSIVFVHAGIYSTEPPHELVIIDGQQRLTTITLIWIVLYRIAKELKNEKLTNQINKKYLVNEFLEDDEKLKLRSTSNNDKALRFLINDKDPEDYDEFSRLIVNFKYFRSEINRGNFELVKKGISKLMFVEISLDRKNDDPQRIFESLNSTGLDLSQADLIRNYILMGIDPSLQEKIYDNYWRSIENLATEVEPVKSRVSDFIRDFLTLKTKEIPNKNKIYQVFKSYYNFDDQKKIEPIMKEIERYAKHYNKLINPEKETDKQLRNQIKLISKLEVNVSHPFILQLYDDYANEIISKQTLIEVLELIQSFIWRRFITGIPTQGLNKVFNRLYEEVDHSDYMLSICKSLLKKRGPKRFPNDEETFRELKFKDVYNIKSNNRAYFLERLENYNNNEPVQIDSDITVEHIFPKNPHPKWKKTLGDKQYNEMKETYLNTIGNLTLSGNNGSLSNKPFIEKRDLPEKGYCASRLFLNKHLSSLDKWDTKEINKRFNLIRDRFKKIWKYPSIVIDEKDNYQEINVFDEDDPTGQKLDYIIYFDRKTPVSSWQELYKIVLSSLYETQPETFHSTNLGDKLKLTKSKEKHYKSVEISETYYAEAPLSAREILKRIKLTLKTFKLFDDLHIKFK